MSSPFTGFTPAPDCIRDSIDLTAALVFGAVWRFTQMDRGQCDATVEAIAERAGLKPTATRERLRRLEAEGWVIATTRVGRPTVYQDSRRWVLQVAGMDTDTPTRGVAPPTADVAPPTRNVGVTPTRGVAPQSVPQRVALPKKRREEEEKSEEAPNGATSGPSASEKKETLRARRTPRPADPWFEAICRECGLDTALLDDGQRKAVAVLGADLKANDRVTLEMIDRAGESWRDGYIWREKQSYPTVRQLKTEVGKVLARRNGHVSAAPKTMPTFEYDESYIRPAVKS